MYEGIGKQVLYILNGTGNGDLLFWRQYATTDDINEAGGTIWGLPRPT